MYMPPFLRILICSILVVAMEARANWIDLQTETLGAWKYVRPLDLEVSSYPKLRRTWFGSPVVKTGQHIFVMVPGSARIAEFKNERLWDLTFPDQLIPFGIRADKDGRLWALSKELDSNGDLYPYEKGSWQLSCWDRKVWSHALHVPLTHIDFFGFDSKDRLWVMGTDRKVAVYAKGRWDSYTYSNDKKLRFAPVRMKEESDDKIVLFSHRAKNDRQASQMIGTLTYQNGKFSGCLSRR